MKISIIVALLSFLVTNLAIAHSGRTNSSGCHNDRKTGGYHCHGGSSTSSSSYKSYNTPSKSTVSIRSSLVLQTQKNLNLLGFDAGSEDGIMGKKTMKPIKLFQQKIYEEVNGKASSSLLEKLKREVKG